MQRVGAQRRSELAARWAYPDTSRPGQTQRAGSWRGHLARNGVRNLNARGKEQWRRGHPGNSGITGNSRHPEHPGNSGPTGHSGHRVEQAGRRSWHREPTGA